MNVGLAVNEVASTWLLPRPPFTASPRSAPLLSLFSTIRLSAALEARKAGNLEAIEALLGCPLNLFEMVGLGGGAFG